MLSSKLQKQYIIWLRILSGDILLIAKAKSKNSYIPLMFDKLPGD